MSGPASGWLDGSDGVDDVAGAVCAAAVRLLPVDGAALLLMSGSTRWTTITATDATVTDLLNFEQIVADGPSVEAYRTGAPVLVPDLPAAGGVRWPLLAPAASAIGAYFSFPLQIGVIRLGVLDLYRREAGRLAGDDLGLALQLADTATGALVTHRDADALADPASRPLTDRHYKPEIDQATGMVSVHLGIDIPAAYARMRAHAFVAGLPLAEVATAIVLGALHLDGEQPPARNDQ